MTMASAFKIVRAVKGQTVLILAQVRGLDGALLTAGEVDALLQPQFGDFEQSEIDVDHVWHDPPAGRVSYQPHPAWIPGVDGDDGYNLSVVAASERFPEIGVYWLTITVTVASPEQVHKIVREIRVASS